MSKPRFPFVDKPNGQWFEVEAATAEDAEKEVRSLFTFTPQGEIYVLANQPSTNGRRRVLVEWDEAA